MSLPIRTRLTAVYVALLAVILSSLGAFLLLRLQADLVGSVDRSLDSRAAQISLGYEGGGEGEFQDVTDASLVRLPQGEHGAQILSGGGRVLETSGDLVAGRPMLGPDVLAAVGSDRHVRLTLALGPDHEPFRVLALPAPKHPSDVLVAATSLEEVDASVHRLLVLLLVAGPVALAGAGLVGWWLTRQALSPVGRMTAQAAQIGVDRLDERVAVPRARDELGRLARTFNEMLERLQRGVEEQHRFVADASHELRTPLTAMRSELEVSLRVDSLSPRAREVLKSAADEVERMTRIVENLLTLARIDEGRLQLLRTPVVLGGVVEAVRGALRPLAEAKAIRILVDDAGVVVEADRDRLHQAVTNLLDNAVKYSARGGEVRVSIWRDHAEGGVTVSDSGPGISPEALPRVFDRFFRADRARSRTEGGSGLGLAICREIVQAHGGRVWAESEPGRGSSFSLALPLLRSEARTVAPSLPLPA